MDNYNEREIIALLQDSTRQREAFECIVKEYSEQLYWQIRRMVLSHDDANDILQNTFIKAWMNIDYFRGEAKMSTWLYRIALNECLTFVNKQQANNTLSIDDADIEMIKATRDGISRDAFEKSADAINNAKKIYILGVRSSAALASFAAFYFRFLYFFCWFFRCYRCGYSLFSCPFLALGGDRFFFFLRRLYRI